MTQCEALLPSLTYAGLLNSAGKDFSSVESGKVKRSAGKIQLTLHCSAIAQLLVCLRNVKMNADYKQPTFVISKMNQKEAKLRSSQVSYNLKSFHLQILSCFYKTQQFFSSSDTFIIIN